MGVGRSCCSLDATTAFSPPRAGRTLRPSSTPDCCAAPCWRRFRATPPVQPEIVMNDKSHVSLEQHICLVWGTAFDIGAILQSKALQAIRADCQQRLRRCLRIFCGCRQASSMPLYQTANGYVGLLETSRSRAARRSPRKTGAEWPTELMLCASPGKALNRL